MSDNNTQWLGFFYNYFYDEPFEVKDWESNTKMQNAIHLVHEFGVWQKYDFNRYGYRVYSSQLFDDCLNVSEKDQTKQFPDVVTDIEKAEIELIRDFLIVPGNSLYSKLEWSECLINLLFLIRYNISTRFDDEVIALLIQNKPHLKEVKTNKEALKRIRSLFCC